MKYDIFVQFKNLPDIGYSIEADSEDAARALAWADYPHATEVWCKAIEEAAE